MTEMAKNPVGPGPAAAESQSLGAVARRLAVVALATILAEPAVDSVRLEDLKMGPPIPLEPTAPTRYGTERDQPSDEWLKLSAPAMSSNPERPLGIEPIEAITTALKKSAGVFLGDYHGDKEIPAFIASNMAKLKESGVTTFFIEMFAASAQPLLDNFQRTGNRKDLEQHLRDDGWGKGPGWVEKIVDVVEAARGKGIRVIGIDIPHTGYSRLETSNPAWAETVRSTITDREGRYVVYGGSAHSSKMEFNKGVDQMLQIPAIDFVPLDSEIEIIRNAKGEYEKITRTPGVYKGDGKENDLIIVLPKLKSSLEK